ncbi:MAG: ADP-ribosyl-[dinitrogen reductase] hydrolase [Verrucomicrobiales bacterium]|nr:ADP-ribosyl-[dinitrogen reductase] hydrolase [Verrucomicrobiales bacterium]
MLDRALGAFLGLAVGDALGATVEFMTSVEIAARYRIHNQIIGGGWLSLKPGQVTDDTEMALALGAALIASGGWNLRAIADAFVAWMRRGPVDIGNTTRRGLVHYLSTGQLSVPPSKGDGGNGAAMRHLPAVLVSLNNDQMLVQRCIEQAHITHHHPKSDAAITTLGRMTRRLVLFGTEAAVDELAFDLIRCHPEFTFRPWPGRTSGYVVDTVQTVFDGFFHTDNFEDCLVRVVNRGGDADTAGALAGQLAGALYGTRGIPDRWLNRLAPGVISTVRQQTSKLLRLS